MNEPNQVGGSGLGDVLLTLAMICVAGHALWSILSSKL